jgi:hypothetical protein
MKALVRGTKRQIPVFVYQNLAIQPLDSLDIGEDRLTIAVRTGLLTSIIILDSAVTATTPGTLQY